MKTDPSVDLDGTLSKNRTKFHTTLGYYRYYSLRKSTTWLSILFHRDSSVESETLASRIGYKLPSHLGIIEVRVFALEKYGVLFFLDFSYGEKITFLQLMQFSYPIWSWCFLFSTKYNLLFYIFWIIVHFCTLLR